MPRLFIVATPIGNLSDISARALQTLRDCDLIAAEDTRVTRALLNHFEIDTPCVSNHQHNEENRAAPIVARMLEEDLDVALVTDAGTPCISDPGSFLAKEAAAAGSRCWRCRGRRRWRARFPSAGLTRANLRFTAFCRARSGSFPKSCCDCAHRRADCRRARVAAPRD
ncbi:MAG: SAM-dependent methyltransferase [Christensenellales bacterium]